jgi:hypothetical protein
MTLPITDNFTGVDGDPINGRTTTTGGATWSSDGMIIYQGTCYSNTHTYALVNSGVSDVVVSAKIVAQSPSFWALAFRSNSDFSVHLLAYVTPTTAYIYDENGSPLTSQGGLTISIGDTIEVAAHDTAITVTQNGSTILTYTTNHALTNTRSGREWSIR